MCMYLEPEEAREGKTEVMEEDPINSSLREGEVFYLKEKGHFLPFFAS